MILATDRCSKDDCYFVCEELESSDEFCCEQERGRKVICCPKESSRNECRYDGFKRECKYVDKDTRHALTNIGLLLRNVHTGITAVINRTFEKFLLKLGESLRLVDEKRSSEVKNAAQSLEKTILKLVDTRLLGVLPVLEKSVCEEFKKLECDLVKNGSTATQAYTNLVSQIRCLSPDELHCYVDAKRNGLQQDLLAILDTLLGQNQYSVDCVEKQLLLKIINLIKAELLFLNTGIQKAFKEFEKSLRGVEKRYSSELSLALERSRACVESELFEVLVQLLQRDGHLITTIVRKLVEKLTGCKQREIITPFLQLTHAPRLTGLY